MSLWSYFFVSLSFKTYSSSLSGLELYRDVHNRNWSNQKCTPPGGLLILRRILLVDCSELHV